MLCKESVKTARLTAYSVLIGMVLLSTAPLSLAAEISAANPPVNEQKASDTSKSDSDGWGSGSAVAKEDTGSAASSEQKSDTKNSATKSDVASTTEQKNDTASTEHKAEATTKPATTVRLHAEVVDRASPELTKHIQDLTNAATTKAYNAELLGKEKHYKGALAKIASGTRDLAELCTEYKGFEQSSEAADVILDEKVKMKRGPAVEYLKQKTSDELHERIITAMMQIATGYGNSDQELGKTSVNEGIAELEDVTDKEHATATADMLKTWCQSQKVSFLPPLAGPMQVQAECKDVVGRAIKGDPLVKQISSSLHKFNGRSNLARTAAKVINTTLSVAALSPTLISPASQVAWTAYIMTQGGPEESKLLKEVYLAKEFEARFNTLTSETNLAVNSYNTALTNHNPALLAFSQFELGQLCEPPQPAVTDKVADASLQKKVAGKYSALKQKVSTLKHKVAVKDPLASGSTPSTPAATETATAAPDAKSASVNTDTSAAPSSTANVSADTTAATPAANATADATATTPAANVTADTAATTPAANVTADTATTTPAAQADEAGKVAGKDSGLTQ